VNSISLKPSEFAENFLYVKNRPFSFAGYEYFRPSYDSMARGVVYKTGRQVAKSTSLANRLVIWSCAIPYFSALVVTPIEAQLSVFSKQKLAPVLNSPFIRKHFYSGNKTDQIFYKQLSNGSDVTLRSCFLDAESIRGISCDAVCIDEIQDILTDNIPVIQECYTRSDYKYSIFSGTPKTNQHSIEQFWTMSTQNEWIVKCRSCNYYNYIDESCLQPQGLSCSRCYKLINAQEDGQWVSYDTTGKSRFEGYRIPQVIVPWIAWDLEDAIKKYGDNADEQGTIMKKYQTYSRTRFYNEVLALPYDNALCPITLPDLIDACDPQMKLCESKTDSSVVAKMNLVAGLDHSTSQDSASYTVLTIGGFVPGGRFVIVYAKRYSGIEADVLPMLKHVAQKVRDFGVTVVTSDWGSGATNNVLLREELRKDGIQLIEVNHSGTQKADATWSAKAKMFTINRTHVLTEIFNKIKHKDIIFPNWNQMQPYLTDLLNIYTDYNESLRTVFYNKPQNKPDDYLHALCFAHFGATVQSQS
jgi:hypothetical protein